PDMGSPEGIRQAPRALREGGHLCLEVAVRLLAHFLDTLDLAVHPLERLLERQHPGLGELDEAGAVRVESVVRERRDRRPDAIVEAVALDAQLRLDTR